MTKFIVFISVLMSLSAYADLTPYVGSGNVDSVNGSTGVVVLTTSDFAEGSNLWYTDARAKNACVENSITSGHTTIAPSGDAVFTALALKVPTSRTISTTAPLTGGGDLSGDRTIVIPKSTGSVDGYLDHLDFASFAAKQSTAYTPALSSNWSTVPTTVVGALDGLVVLQQSAVGSQPVCASNHRGLQWLVQGGAGVADIYQICQKDSSDVYGWVTH